LLKQLNPQFSETFPADIWQTALSKSNLLIACREGEGMQVTFSLFDLERKTFKWESVSFEESWWISIYAFEASVIVFQIFNDSQNIEARSLFGFDISKMEAIWSIEDVVASTLSGDILKLKVRSEEECFFYIDINSGIEIQKVDFEIIEKNVSKELILPLHYQSDSPHFQSVKEFLKEFLKVELVGACDYLEYNGLILIAAHQKVEQNLTNTLFVLNASGDLLLTEVLAEHCKGLASDTFYIVNEQLIFVKEKREIKGYLI
jgi:hypothetical protein